MTVPQYGEITVNYPSFNPGGDCTSTTAELATAFRHDEGSFFSDAYYSSHHAIFLDDTLQNIRLTDPILPATYWITLTFTVTIDGSAGLFETHEMEVRYTRGCLKTQASIDQSFADQNFSPSFI